MKSYNYTDTPKRLSETYREMNIEFEFPIRVFNKNNRTVYTEYGNGYVEHYTYNDQNLLTSYKDNEGHWGYYTYDADGNEIDWSESHPTIAQEAAIASV